VRMSEAGCIITNAGSNKAVKSSVDGKGRFPIHVNSEIRARLLRNLEGHCGKIVLKRTLKTQEWINVAS
jgi:hypothetical protein